MATPKERFEKHFIPEPNSGCWLWLASLGTTGYGQFNIDQYPFKAHRVSWLLYRGEIPAGLFILHKCDVRICVNPDHLYLGSAKDNVRDLMARGKPYCFNLIQFRTPELETKIKSRLPRGLNHPRQSAKLTPEQAKEIFHCNDRQSVIARRFGINQSTVSRIKTQSRKNWGVYLGNTP